MKTLGVIIPTRVGNKTSILKCEVLAILELQSRMELEEIQFLCLSESAFRSMKKFQASTEAYSWKNFKIRQIDSLGQLDSLGCDSFYYFDLLRYNFFGGMIDKSAAINYSYASYCTNVLKATLYWRIADCSVDYMDFKKFVENRLTFDDKDEFSNRNKEILEILSCKYIDYDKVKFLANGDPKISAWVEKSCFLNVREAIRVPTYEQIETNSVYLSDDVFFQVKKNYDLFRPIENPRKNSLLFIGFLKYSTQNWRRKALNRILTDIDVPIDIFGPGAGLLKKKNEKTTLIDDYIPEIEHFQLIHDHLALVFVGKGTPTLSYINKTAYDAVIARTPILVDRRCDQNHILFQSDEFYFSSTRELSEKYQLLMTGVERQRWIDEQKAEIFAKLF